MLQVRTSKLIYVLWNYFYFSFRSQIILVFLLKSLNKALSQAYKVSDALHSL